MIANYRSRNALMAMVAASTLILLLVISPVAAAEKLSGTAPVIDGDTISVDATIIRLEGLDAPELAQT
ncbi:MAG: hypothetical protein AAFY56_12650 [Pseudomonadota bacterium]